jgi:hypothetical protein
MTLPYSIELANLRARSFGRLSLFFGENKKRTISRVFFNFGGAKERENLTFHYMLETP